MRCWRITASVSEFYSILKTKPFLKTDQLVALSSDWLTAGMQPVRIVGQWVSIVNWGYR